jgi:hypothetical protein
MKLSFWIRLLLFGIVVVLFLVLILQKCLNINEDWKNVLIGFFTSSLVVLMIELVNWIYGKNKLSKLTGKYSRVKITQEDLSITSGISYKDMTEEYKDVNISINLKYRGEGEYTGSAYYKGGKVKFIINLDKANPNIGKGVYQYIKSEHPDFGTYDIKIDSDDSNVIYVSYSNIIPSGRARGYEIWERND